MLFSDASAFFLAQVAFALSPGPLIIMLIVRAAGNDLYGALSYTFGASLGVAVIICVVAAGLGSLFLEQPWLTPVSKIALVLYFAWLAKEMWQGGIRLTEGASCRTKGILSSALFGLGLCLVSPHVVMFNTVLVPDMLAADAADWFRRIAVICLGFLSFMISFGVVVCFAAKIAEFVSDPARSMALSRCLAGVLVLAGAWIVMC